MAYGLEFLWLGWAFSRGVLLERMMQHYGYRLVFQSEGQGVGPSLDNEAQ
jgi:hypothetical protein